ncbi:MAG TPA: MerR family transcriptional regulator [Actinophytocola sp.]|uniref:MerR family transcriptional regulator n=1 Tax=Actinophytocola sp. TaxID=1872138 RepID=UPI002DF84FBE|nr:MerR family transcriptional regulator [Actinophytocola sp.]
MATKSEPAIDGHDLMREPTLPVAAVARRLGIAPATLRTWDRRYGIGPSGHTTGRHRRYAPADIARLEMMQRALLRGATPAEAAEYALRATPEPGVAPAGSADDLEAELASLIGGAVTGRPGGGSVLRLPGRSPAARGLGRAALAMDATAAQQLITDAIAEQGVIPVWDTVIRPVLAAVAARWEHSGEYVEVEHLLHECALAAVIGATPLVSAPRNPRPVLLCCVPDERHSLPLYVLRAALAARGLGTQLLGAALPADALAAAVRRTAPAAVALWAQLPRHASAPVFDHIPKTRQPIRLFAAGPGWHTTDLPTRVERLDDLPAAVDRLESLL